MITGGDSARLLGDQPVGASGAESADAAFELGSGPVARSFEQDRFVDHSGQARAFAHLGKRQLPVTERGGDQWHFA
nr:hypothetical protein [Cumulibacter soli]